ncbi:CAF1 family ribonuclease [Toxoplasma gondii ME49]|uniref:Poly(A)-specific ribonuclease PARN n=8 Tax=Toxoplasma gondii TaxID=5811 RepID=A0A0F7V2M7_TOXGV|nr:CAF1 family ribonuclease [Toxoplasma gondii ME49]EPT28730.1 CAF1 family ribonuclease [Toxoplasma gondii ME49]ESS36074.1 CAF1 family ribonuclease [Toxoplasma gondii VEG]CEL75038.1 TPA: poly(A)-specific ribonuclease, putative [Toxoplasma gondii VEG]|eukprot:XP_018636758.1 CAF1 family ribonuclease [Toxoplasma gondii ME49]
MRNTPLARGICPVPLLSRCSLTQRIPAFRQVSPRFSGLPTETRHESLSPESILPGKGQVPSGFLSTYTRASEKRCDANRLANSITHSSAVAASTSFVASSSRTRHGHSCTPNPRRGGAPGAGTTQWAVTNEQNPLEFDSDIHRLCESSSSTASSCHGSMEKAIHCGRRLPLHFCPVEGRSFQRYPLPQSFKCTYISEPTTEAFLPAHNSVRRDVSSFPRVCPPRFPFSFSCCAFSSSSVFSSSASSAVSWEVSRENAPLSRSLLNTREVARTNLQTAFRFSTLQFFSTLPRQNSETDREHRLEESPLHATHTTNRESWPTHLEALREVLAKAEFVALDVELTGLHMKNEKFLGVDRCYEAHCEGAKNFLPVQLGLCAARRASAAEPHKWILTPASVYMFPRDARLFQASTGTLMFLRENGFDFNKWLDQGIPFLRAQEEKEKRQALQVRIDDLEHLIKHRSRSATLRESQESSSLLDTSKTEDRELAASARAAIHAWLASSSPEPLHLPVESPLQRLLLHSLVAAEFPSLYSLSVKVGDRRVLAIYQSEEEVYEEQLRGLREDIHRVEELRGVRQLLDDVSDQKLLVVGHNCFYDFLHIFQTLYADLPQSVSEFKTTWTQLFPATFDTKLIAESHDALAPLQSPATLQGLCSFMGALAVASQEPLSKEEQGEREREKPALGMPAPLQFQLELLPGTKWTLPPAVQPLSVPPVSLFPARPTRGSSVSPRAEESGDRLEDAGEKAMTGRTEEQTAAVSAQDQDASSTTVEEDFSHDAGYDSMMTTIVFLLQLSHVLPRQGLKWKNIQFRAEGGRTLGRRQGLLAGLGEPRRIASAACKEKHSSSGVQEGDKEERVQRTTGRLTASEEIQNIMDSTQRKAITDLLPLFVNRIRLSRSQPSSINLGGQDEQLQQQKRLLLMRNHPTHWKKWEIMKIWSPVWVDVQPVDSSTSWIVVRDEEDLQNVMAIYEMLQNPEFELLNYDQYRALQQQQQQRP